MTRRFSVFVIISVVIFLGITGSYFLYILPNQNQAKLEFEKQKFESEQRDKAQKALIEENERQTKAAQEDAQMELEKQKFEAEQVEKLQKRLDEEQDRQTKDEEAQAKRTARENCLIEAHDRFVQEGLAYCLQHGFSKEDFENLRCKMPLNDVQRLESKQKEAQELCLKVF